MGKVCLVAIVICLLLSGCSKDVKTYTADAYVPERVKYSMTITVKDGYVVACSYDNVLYAPKGEEEAYQELLSSMEEDSKEANLIPGVTASIKEAGDGMTIQWEAYFDLEKADADQMDDFIFGYTDMLDKDKNLMLWETFEEYLLKFYTIDEVK